MGVILFDVILDLLSFGGYKRIGYYVAGEIWLALADISWVSVVLQLRGHDMMNECEKITTNISSFKSTLLTVPPIQWLTFGPAAIGYLQGYVL